MGEQRFVWHCYILWFFFKQHAHIYIYIYRWYQCVGNFLGASEATGLDDLSFRFIQDGATSTAVMVTHIVDMSIVQGNIPDDLKRDRSTPQKSSRTDPSMYRPTSILITVSNFTEKVTREQVEINV